MSVWLRRIVDRLVAPEGAGPEPSLTIDELFPPVPADLTRELTKRDRSIEDRIRNYDRAIEEAIADGNLAAVDTFLDARNKVRPARPAELPVVPGSSS